MNALCAGHVHIVGAVTHAGKTVIDISFTLHHPRPELITSLLGSKGRFEQTSLEMCHQRRQRACTFQEGQSILRGMQCT